MKRLLRFLCLCLIAALLAGSVASADFDFSDDRFRGDFSTDNLNRIIEEYELYDGWYWTSRPYVAQSFHGLENMPGWTDTSVNVYERKGYIRGYYGCRWNSVSVLPELPTLGWGECYGFASFVGYLLSGEYNPHGHWNRYYSLEASSGLQVGDIVRTEFTAGDKKYRHSAVVYSVDEDEILFLQVSGSTYNRISVGSGFSDGYQSDLRTLEDLHKVPDIRVMRSPLND